MAPFEQQNTETSQENQTLHTLSDQKLRTLYDAFREEQKKLKTQEEALIVSETKDELGKLRADLVKEYGSSAQDRVEEEIVGRIIEKSEKLSALFTVEKLTQLSKKNPEKAIPQLIDAQIIQIFKDTFHLDLSQEDLQSLRDDLPLIDDLQNGKLVAYGNKGNRHAVLFDRMQIIRNTEGISGAYTFLYELDAQIQGTETFQNQVKESKISLGGTTYHEVTADGKSVEHQFSVKLAPAENSKASVLIQEVKTDDPRLMDANGEKRPGVILTNREQKTWTILIDESLPSVHDIIPHEDAFSAEVNLPDTKESVIAHEIEHLAGSTHFDHTHETDHDHEEILFPDAQLASSDSSINVQKDPFDRPEKENFLGFDLKDQLNKLLEKNGVPKEVGTIIQDSIKNKKSYNEFFDELINYYKIKEKVQQKFHVSDENVATLLETFKTSVSSIAFKDQEVDLDEKVGIQSMLTAGSRFAPYQQNIEGVVNSFIQISEMGKTIPDTTKPYLLKDEKLNLDLIIDQVPIVQNFITKPHFLGAYIREPSKVLNIMQGVNDYMNHVKQSVSSAPAAAPGSAPSAPVQIPEYVPSLDVGVMDFTSKFAETSDGNYETYFKTLIGEYIKEDVSNREDQINTAYTALQPQLKTTNEFKADKHAGFKVEKQGAQWKITYVKKPEENTSVSMIERVTQAIEQAKILFAKGDLKGGMKKIMGGILAGVLGFFGLDESLAGMFGFEVDIPPEKMKEFMKKSFSEAFKKSGISGNEPSDAWFESNIAKSLCADGNWTECLEKPEIKSTLVYFKNQNPVPSMEEILNSAYEFTQRSDKNQTAENFFTNKKQEAEKKAQESNEGALKNDISQAWQQLKTAYGNIDLDPNAKWNEFFGISERMLAADGNPDIPAYQAKMKEVLAQKTKENFGGEILMKRWCSFKKQNGSPMSFEDFSFWKNVESQKANINLPQNFNIGTIDFNTWKNQFQKDKPVAQQFSFPEFFASLTSLSAEDLKVYLLKGQDSKSSPEVYGR